MLITALFTACFSRVKIDKKLWFPYLSFGSYFKICPPPSLLWMLWLRHC